MSKILPTEVISHILKFLSVSDRKEASLVCDSWYQASLDPVLQKDLVVRIYTSVLSDEDARRLSRRHLSHLILNHVDNSTRSKDILLRFCDNLSDSLQTLSLKGCDITETFFVKLLSKCKDLKLLDLTSCNSLFMSGNILEKNSDMQLLKKSLKKVEVLVLSSIRFLSDASFNRMVTVCANVKEISLASAHIIFSNKTYYPDGMTVCASSSVLTFQNIITFIKTNCSNIKSINFSRTSINNDYLHQLAKVDGLDLNSITLINCKDLTDCGIANLCTNQQSLEKIDFSYCTNISDGAIGAVSKNLPNIHYLKASNCPQITEQATCSLKHCPELEVLDLSGCSHLGSKGLIHGLCSYTQCHLTSLNLSCCSLLTDKFIVKLCGICTHLSELDLGSCFLLTDLSIHAISKSLCQLRSLRLAWCKEISDFGLLGFKSAEVQNGDTHAEHGDYGQCRCTRKHYTNVFHKPSGVLKEKKLSVGEMEEQLKTSEEIFQLCNITGLRSLDLMACSKLTEAGIKQAIRFPDLKILKLSMIHSLSDAGIIAVAEANPSLEEIHFSQCPEISDWSIEFLTKKCLRLKHINMSSCDKVTNQAISYITDNCKLLRYLDVSFCNRIDYSSVQTLESNLKSLQSVQKCFIGGGIEASTI